MTSLVEWSLLVVGLTYWLTMSGIFAPLRLLIASAGAFWEALIYCPMCTGFWVGAALGVCHAHTFDVSRMHLVANTFASAFAAMGLMFVVIHAATGGANPAYNAERGGGVSPDATPEHEPDTSEVES
jgi:hypothetical protein